MARLQKEIGDIDEAASLPTAARQDQAVWRCGQLQPRSLGEFLRGNIDHSVVIFGGVGKQGPYEQWATKCVALDPDPAL